MNFQNQDSLNVKVVDTVVSVSDTVNLSISSAFELFQGDEKLVVETLNESTSGIELWALWIGLIAAIITVIYTLLP